MSKTIKAMVIDPDGNVTDKVLTQAEADSLRKRGYIVLVYPEP